MVALGPAIREPDHLNDAMKVARETMNRARHNIELIIKRLDQLNYRFWQGREQSLVKPIKKVTFAGQVIETETTELLLEKMFAIAKTLSTLQLTPIVVQQLFNVYQTSIYPYLDKELIFKGLREELHAEATASFDEAKNLPTEALSVELFEVLDDVSKKALQRNMAQFKSDKALPRFRMLKERLSII